MSIGAIPSFDRFYTEVSSITSLQKESITTFVGKTGLIYTLDKVEQGDDVTFSKYIEFSKKLYRADLVKHIAPEMIENLLNSHFSTLPPLFQEGQLPLMIIYRDDEIVGGAFYLEENDGSNIRIRTFTLDQDLGEEDKILFRKKFVKYLSNLRPYLSKVVILLRHNDSEEIEYSKQAGFIESTTYINDDYSKDEFLALEINTKNRKLG